MQKIVVKENSTRKIKLQFSLLQFTFWCSWCAFTSFSLLYFKSMGLSDTQIGFALSINILCGILGQLIWGFLCDRFRTIRKIFILANFMIGVIVLLFLIAKSPLFILSLMGLLGFAQIPQPAILDTWILKKMPGREQEYGSIRLWASIGFALSALVFGRLIDRFGYPTMFISALFFLVLSLILSWMIPDIKEKITEREGLKKAYKELLTRKTYLFFICICFTIGLAARTTHTLLPLIIEKVNGHAGHLGLALFITGIAEIPMLIASRKFGKRFKSLNLILLSCFFYLVQFIFLFLAKSPLLIFFAMIFQGLAFGNYLPSVRLFVYENAPKNLRTTTQTLTDGISSSLTGVIGSAVGGVIIQNFGVHTMVIICIFLIASVIIVLLLRACNKKNH